MALTFERRGSTWVCFDPQWDLMLIARDLYFGTERLVTTITCARLVEGSDALRIQTERLDLLINSRCATFAKECARRLKSGSIGNEEANQTAIHAMLDALKDHLLGLRGEIENYDLTDILVPADMTPRYALWPIVPSSRPGMVVGPSGQGKSGFAAFGGLSVVTGLTLHPRLEPRIEGPVLYIGQEEDKEQWAARLHQMCKGHGIELPKHYTYLKLSTSSLIDSAERIAELAAVKHAVLIIVDSAQATWGMEGDSVRGYATQWFNAVDQLGVPTLVVEHPNLADTRKPIPGGFAAGSSVKRDRVGHAWNLKSVLMPTKPEEPSRYHVTLSDTKRNYVAHQPDITYETLIYKHEWIRFVEAEALTAETIVSTPSRVDNAIAAEMRRDTNKAWTTKELVEATGKDDREVRRSLGSDYWRPSPFDTETQFRFERLPGTGEPPGSRTNPGQYILASQRVGIQMSMLPGDPDEVQ